MKKFLRLMCVGGRDESGRQLFGGRERLEVANEAVSDALAGLATNNRSQQARNVEERRKQQNHMDAEDQKIKDKCSKWWITD